MFQGAKEINPITIGNDVLIGTRVVIMLGETMGKHVIIGAGSIVTIDI